MKKLFAGTPHTKFIAAASALTWTIAMANSAGAAQLQEARVTQVVNDVKLLLEQAAPRPAAISDLVRRGNAVRTGPQSRSELTFADLTITRLGANTIFSFKEGTREMNLIDGAILFQVPKGSGGATIRTVGVTAAITGTTGIAEFHPATTSHPQLSKWLCLEGTFHLYLPNGQSVELGPGKIVTSDGKSFSKVSTFDIAKLVSTSLFFTGFDQPLASMNLIMLESENQLASSLFATSTTNPLDPARIVNVTSQAIAAEETPTSPAASPTPPITPTPPSKFGTPSVISSPVPYLITNGTVITTDPSITTNSVTDYGKIYRGQTDDGAFSLWAFGSTSAFDTALRIDNIFFADPSHLPVAVFKFESLSLTGDPTIDTSNGVPKLALIGVDGITSGPPGGTLKFTGLDLLLLATVNGSINLTSDVSFQDLHELVMYARGAGSDLTINSPISNIGILGLVAEDSIHLTNPGTMSVGKIEMAAGSDLMLQIGGSLLLNGSMRLDAIVLPGASVASGVNLTLNVTGDYRNNSATASSQLIITNRDHIGGDASIAVGATNIFTANNLDVQIDNRVGGHIGENALVNVGVSGGDINIVGDATFQILNNFRGHIGRDANIFVTTGAGGDFTANSILAFVNNHNGGAIGSGAELTFNIGGTLVTQGDATFVISNLNEGPGGGTIGSLATVDINAASISVGGFFQTFVGANGGGSIQGDAINTVNVSGDLTAQQGILVDIQDTGFNQINPINFIAGGHIGGDATVTLAAQNIVTSSTATGVPGIDTMALEASIYSDGSGTIGGNAIVNVTASQNISAPGTVFFTVDNSNYMGFGGGTIGGDAQVNVTASNLSTGALFDDIYNNGGASIGRDAIISLNLSNSFTATGDAEFRIFSPGGIITRNASIGVSAGDITAPSLTAEIDNSSAGQIGGNALINFGVSGDVNIAGDASFQILNNAGTIGGDTEIDVNAANITANSLLAQIDNSNGGSIGTGGNISVTTGGDFTSNGDASFAIHNTAGSINNGGNITLTVGGSVSTGGQLSLVVENYDFSTNPAGHIGTGGNISVTTPGDLTADSVTAAINNRNGGTIGSGVSLIFDISGALTTQHDGTDYLGFPSSLSLYVTNRYDGTRGSTIGGNATLALSADSADIDGNLNAHIGDRGGTIDGNALLNFNVAHDVTVQEDALWQILNDSGTNMNAASPIGGTIHGTANLLFSAANLTLTAGSLELDIFNKNGGVVGSGGTIDSDANITFALSGNLTTAGSAIFEILNQLQPGGTTGGTIGGDATINVTTANVSAGVDSLGRSLDALIANQRGSIDGSAIVNVEVTDVITAQGPANFTIDNSSGGTIGGDAVINVSAGSITASSLLAKIDNSNGGTIGASANISLATGGDFATSVGDATFTINNTAGTITNNANLALNAGRSVSAAGELSLFLENYDESANPAGHIRGSANVSLITGGNLTAEFAQIVINNRGGGRIDSGATLTMDITGTLTTLENGPGFLGDLGSLSLAIATRDDNGTPGSFIGGDATLALHADSANIGGILSAYISNRSGTIDGNALLTFSIVHDFTTQGEADWEILNGAPSSPFGGTIHGNATIQLSAANMSGNPLFAYLDNRDGGGIDSAATIDFNLTGNLTTPGDATFQIENQRHAGFGGPTGGSIGEDATLSIAAASFSVGRALDIDINNSNNGSGSGAGGSIGGNAAINLNIANTLSSGGAANFQISNDSAIAGSPGGSIGGDAAINLTATNISVGTPLAPADLDVSIGNTSGSIGGSVATNLNVSGDISVAGAINARLSNDVATSSLGSHLTGDATINVLGATGINAGNGAFFAIGNADAGPGTFGGTINRNALVHVTADHLSTEALAPSDFNLFGTIHNSGGTIGGNSDVMFDIAGAITTAGTASFDTLNYDNGGPNGGGIIGGNATVSVSAGSLSIGGELLLVKIINERGAIDGNALINANVSGAINTQGEADFQIFNENNGSGGGSIGLDATINLNAANISTGGSLFADIFNSSGGTIGGGAMIDVTAANITANSLVAEIDNSNGGMIGGAANVAINIGNNVTTLDGITLQILNSNLGHIVTGADVLYSAGGTTSTTNLTEYIDNSNGGAIDNGGNITLHTVGPVMLDGPLFLDIDNFNGGTIGRDVTLSVSAANISTGGNLGPTIDNSIGGTIGGNANLNFNLTGNLTSQGDATFQILNNDGGQIANSASIAVATGGDLTANSVFAFVNNRNGGSIGSGSNLTFDVGGALSTTGDATFVISNRNDGSGGGTIGGNVSLTLSATSISGGGILVTDVSTNQGGHIMGSAHNTVDAAGLLSGGTLDFEIENAGFDTGGGFEPGGTIDADAILSVTASDISTTSDYFNAIITNDGGGHIGGNATVSVVASSMDVATNAFFNILNGQNGAGTPTGSIGGNAAIDVAAATLSIGGNLDSGIDNSGGSISGMAQIIFNLAGNLTTQSDALFVINNSSIDGGVSTGTIGSDATIDLSANNISTGGSLSAAIDNSSGLGNGAIGGTIGGDATVNITATNLTANSLLAQINNTNGSIGASTEGGAVINMNVSGTATVTNDATVQILGSDGAVGGAGININGGSYNVGGTFLSYIDGNGTIAFNNINAHADVLKAGVFGTNGVLNVGGGILEANTTLKLYASGSNGVLNFLNSVTLRGSALTKILAANTINIFDNVLVTIGGSTPADVYTNHANYTGFGGNGTRTGTFAGAGAHDPQPLASAPPFGPASPVKLTIGGNIPSATAVPPQSAPGRTPAPGGNITSRTRIPPTLPSNVLTNGKIADVRRASNVINVRSSDELLSLLDDAAPGPGGKITIPPAKSTNHSKNSNRTNVPGRVNTGSRVNVDRRAMDMRTASSSVIRHSPQ